MTGTYTPAAGGGGRCPNDSPNECPNAPKPYEPGPFPGFSTHKIVPRTPQLLGPGTHTQKGEASTSPQREKAMQTPTPETCKPLPPALPLSKSTVSDLLDSRSQDQGRQETRRQAVP